MITGTYFEEFEMCAGEHCHQREQCARWIYNVDMYSPVLKNVYINFNKKHWPDYKCPYFLQFPNPDYPVARLHQYDKFPVNPLPPEDIPPYKRK